jgi:alkanesulfonate monooxygenase SsuD/methylene tetrahydromethanopterin reductase-like flavin-dependent oxidoreductase (luciferase family)
MTLPTMVPDLAREDVLAWCERIDAGSFSTIAVGERIAFPNQECLVMLSAAAALTRRVRVFATVFVLPMHDPVWLAKQAATLDVLCGGRFVLGVGAGAREEDYRSVGASFVRRHARMAESVAAMRRTWQGEPAFAGAQPVGPRPVQPGGPPILVGALAPHAIARAAAWADGLAGFSLGPDTREIGRAFRAAHDAWREAGRERPPRLVTSFWYALGPNARAQLDAYVDRYLRIFGPGAVAGAQRAAAAASPRAVHDALRDIEAAGGDEVILVPTSADMDQLERLQEVLG